MNNRWVKDRFEGVTKVAENDPAYCTVITQGDRPSAGKRRHPDTRVTYLAGYPGVLSGCGNPDAEETVSWRGIGEVDGNDIIIGSGNGIAGN